VGDCSGTVPYRHGNARASGQKCGTVKFNPRTTYLARFRNRFWKDCDIFVEIQFHERKWRRNRNISRKLNFISIINHRIFVSTQNNLFFFIIQNYHEKYFWQKCIKTNQTNNNSVYLLIRGLSARAIVQIPLFKPDRYYATQNSSNIITSVVCDHLTAVLAVATSFFHHQVYQCLDNEVPEGRDILYLTIYTNFWHVQSPIYKNKNASIIFIILHFVYIFLVNKTNMFLWTCQKCHARDNW
jgi:hypothetical protein